MVRQIFCCRDGQARVRGEHEHEHFHPTLANRRRIRLSLRLISSHGIPSRDICVVLCHTLNIYSTHAHMDVRVAPQYTSGPGRSNQFHLPATFTWIVCRALLSLPPSLVPGFRRARHFTYAARDTRARIYPAQTSPYIVRCMDILVADFRLSSFCRRRCTAFRASSIRISVGSPAHPRHLIEKPHAK